MGSFHATKYVTVDETSYFQQLYDSVNKSYTLMLNVSFTPTDWGNNNYIYYIYRPDTEYFVVAKRASWSISNPIFTDDDIGKTVDIYVIYLPCVNDENCPSCIVPVDITHSGDGYYFTRILYADSSYIEIIFGLKRKSATAYVPFICNIGNTPCVQLIGGRDITYKVNYMSSANLKVDTTTYADTVAFRVVDTTKRASITITTTTI